MKYKLISIENGYKCSSCKKSMIRAACKNHEYIIIHAKCCAHCGLINIGEIYKKEYKNKKGE